MVTRIKWGPKLRYTGSLFVLTVGPTLIRAIVSKLLKKGLHRGLGSIIGVIKGDARSLDYGSYAEFGFLLQVFAERSSRV